MATAPGEGRGAPRAPDRRWKGVLSMEFGDPMSEPSPCCANLRCKSMFYRADERPGLLHNEEAMGYWCNLSGGQVGPDKKVALHKLCQAGRGCFEDGPRG